MSKSKKRKDSKKIEIEIVITKSGGCFLPRGTKKQNRLMASLAQVLSSEEDVSDFFEQGNSRELIFGDEFLCG